MTEPERLQAAFERIANTRMAGLPMNNPALQVACVGFREWQGMVVGVLITPWTINLVILPGELSIERGDFSPLGLDQHREWSFPSGRYCFMGGQEPECGPFHSCSLFSPPVEFQQQEGAVRVADEVMAALFEIDGLAGADPSQPESRDKPAPVMSRRAFLRGGSVLG